MKNSLKNNYDIVHNKSICNNDVNKWFDKISPINNIYKESINKYNVLIISISFYISIKIINYIRGRNYIIIK
jgi:hypothetical protein